MKASLFIIAGILFSATSFSQISYVSFKPVESNEINLENSTSDPVQTQLQQLQNEIKKLKQKKEESTSQKVEFPKTIGYYYDNYSKQYKAVKIKINTVTQCGLQRVFIRSTYDSQLGMWTPCNSSAGKVSSSDGEWVVNNFEWEANANSFGVIYFNN